MGERDLSRDCKCVNTQVIFDLKIGGVKKIIPYFDYLQNSRIYVMTQKIG